MIPDHASLPQWQRDLLRALETTGLHYHNYLVGVYVVGAKRGHGAKLLLCGTENCMTLRLKNVRPAEGSPGREGAE